MDAYLPTYEAEPPAAAADVWGNEVANASGTWAAVHRAQNGTTCLAGCARTLSEQIGEGMSWITGSYEVLNTQTGQAGRAREVPGGSVAARGIEPDQFCLNESCHNMTPRRPDPGHRRSGAQPARPSTVRNQCSDCHKAHALP